MSSMDTPTEGFPSKSYPMVDIPSEIPSNKSYAFSGKIMLTSIIILSSVLLLMLLLHLYVRLYLCRRRRSHHLTASRRHHRTPTRIVFYSSSGPLSPPNLSRGLPASVLASLPVLSYDPKTPIPECAVCLSEFENGEKVRLLPKCGHAFHVGCIDMWFHSHATCPICRSSVEKFRLSSGRAGPGLGAMMSPMLRSPMVKLDVENGAFPGRAEAGCCDTNCHAFRSSDDHIIDVELGLPGRVKTGSGSGPCATCLSASSSVDRRKEWRNGKVRIEVPRRRTELGPPGSGASSPASQGFWSPATRLKRILSMGIRSAMVSPASGPSCESTGSDLECGVCESTQDNRAPTPR